MRQHEIPAARTQDYIAFAKAARADEAQTLIIETGTVTESAAIPDTVKNEDLIQAADAANQNRNYPLAETLFKKVLERDPKNLSVRDQLGFALLGQQKFDEAIAVLREQIKLNPFDDSAYNQLGRVFWRQQKYADAESAFRKQIEVTPLDQWVHGNLGLMLAEWRKYKEAIPELERAIPLNPEAEFQYQLALGRSYLNLKVNEKAMSAFERAMKLRPGALTWNDVAYTLAEAKVELTKAQQYAESAVTAVETDLRNADLDRLTAADLQNVAALAADWDTLGWVYFQKGDVDRAEKYIKAAWLLEQHGEVGYHLGQIHEKNGKTDDAIRLYAEAAGSMRTVPEAAESLERLVGKDKTATFLRKGDEEMRYSRTISFAVPSTFVKGATQARFFVALIPGAAGLAEVSQVKFITGDEQLKSAVGVLKTLKFDFVFPREGATKIIRRGTLSCGAGRCDFIMMSPDAVTSID